MSVKWPQDLKVDVPEKGFKKYMVTLRDGKKVTFGDRRYEHYKDRVPKHAGGQNWSHLDHRDQKRRHRYRARHGALKCKNGQTCIDIKYSPAWFSYHFLW